MGYFGKSLTASDTYMDFESNLMEFLGYKYNEEYDSNDYKPHTEIVGKESFDGNVENIIEWMKESEMTIDEGMFLAYHLLIRGVDISNERIDKFIDFFKDDGWAKEDLERKIYMDSAIKFLENYKTDKAPVDIDIVYDFETYFYKQYNNEEGLLSIEEIVKFMEKSLDITIMFTLTDKYELIFLVSNADYEKIGRQKICGIKFLKQIYE